MTDGFFIDPLTGELREATTDALKAARHTAYDEIGRIKAALAPIQHELAERAGPATLPARRYRSDLQAATACCPRCGDPLPTETPASTETAA